MRLIDRSILCTIWHFDHRHKTAITCLGPHTQRRPRCLQVNIASRNAALSPGATDPIGIFAGVYTTHYLPTAEGKNVRSGPELSIATNGNGAHSDSANIHSRESSSMCCLLGFCGP